MFLVATLLTIAGGSVVRLALHHGLGVGLGRRAWLAVAGLMFVVTLPAPLQGFSGIRPGGLVVVYATHVIAALGALIAAEVAIGPFRPWGARPFQRRKTQTQWAAVTGATDGIGAAVSLELARQGYNVVGFGRSPEKARDLEARAAPLPGKLCVISGNVLHESAEQLGSSINLLAQEPFSMVVHSIGILNPAPASSAGREDDNLAVSWRARVELQSRFSTTGDCRVVNVAVSRRKAAPIDVPKWDPSAEGHAAHGLAQAANLIWVHYLRDTGVSAYSYGPGSVRTSIRRSLPPFARALLAPVFWPMSRSAESAARDVVRLCLDAGLPGDGGSADRFGYFDDRRGYGTETSERIREFLHAAGIL